MVEKLKPAKQFEELWVWQEARKLVAEVYHDMNNGAGAKDFGFRDQLQRAAV